MKVSVNTVRSFIDFELPPVEQLVERINQQLGSVENVTDLGEKYKDALIVVVAKCEKHSNADQLSVCLIDDGGVTKNVERDEHNLIQVVCGAPNVTGGMLAVWLPPRATVPSTYNDPQPFVLDTREIRGIKSNGMLAAADELSIGNDHSGIVEITDYDLLEGTKMTDQLIGQSFADVFGLNDVIIDIENKMFTHRPDLFGQLGVAREIAGILGHTFTSPHWYKDVPKFEIADGLKLETFNDATKKVPRLMFVAMKNVEVKPSPLWLQCALVAMGSKPINNIVDVTNYVMLLTAQPTHAYDYDKIRGAKIGTRMAKAGETIKLLNGKDYQLTANDVVIGDADGAIGLAGIMGGSNTEVSAETKNIVLEVGTFDMYAVRKTSMRHGLFTDALTRFNKGQSPLQNDQIMNVLMMSMKDVSPAEQASQVYDEKLSDVATKLGFPMGGPEEVSANFINLRLGSSLTTGEMIDILNNVEFNSYQATPRDALFYWAPFWRMDIQDSEDIVEEIGRLHGFDKLPRKLPARSTKPAPRNQLRQMNQHVRNQLSRTGANEVLTYSFVHENVMKRAGQNPDHAYKLSNALSPDLQYYRLSLTPSLLDKIHMNIKAGYGAFALFELGRSHFKNEMDTDEPSVPNEDNQIALVLAANDKSQQAGAPFYLAKQYLLNIVNLDTVKLVALADFDVATDPWGAQLCAVYEPSRSAVIVKDNQIWGVVGEFRTSVKKAFKLPDWSAGFEIHTDLLNGDQQSTYTALSKFPSISQDISLKVAAATSYQAVMEVVDAAAEEKSDVLVVTWTPLAIYQAANDSATKTITLRVHMTSHERTLTDDDAKVLLDHVAMRAFEKLNASVV